MLRLFKLLLLTFLYINHTDAQNTFTEIGESLNRFVDSLEPTQKRQTVFRFSDSARTEWTNLPVGARPRKGISIAQLTIAQRQLFHRILSASFSNQGYLKITGVMHLDNLTNRWLDSLHDSRKMNDTLYQMFKSFQYGHHNYYITVFGSPLKDSAWGYRIEGHHLSISITYKNGHLFFTPFFIGAIPAQVPLTEYAGWRVLGREQDLGLRLFASLSTTQIKETVSLQEMPQDIFTDSESGKNTIDYWGISCNKLTARQRKLVEAILSEYWNNLPALEAANYKQQTGRTLKDIYFGWIGKGEENEPHYFVLNGPNFLLEFADVGNHIHSILREKRKEFGESGLKKRK